MVVETAMEGVDVWMAGGVSREGLSDQFWRRPFRGPRDNYFVGVFGLREGNQHALLVTMTVASVQYSLSVPCLHLETQAMKHTSENNACLTCIYLSSSNAAFG